MSPSRHATLVSMVMPVVLFAAPASHANLHPIDDFEVGGCSLAATNNPVEADVPIAGYPSHALWSTRHLSLDPNCSASLSPAPSSDDAAVFSAEGLGSCFLTYDWGFPRDLTFGGTVEHLTMIVNGTAGKPVNVTIDNGTMTYGFYRTLQAGGVQVLDFDFAAVPSGYLTQAVSLRFTFPGTGYYEVYDIRFGDHGAAPVDFQGNFVATQIPPVPSPPLVFDLYSAITAESIYRGEVAIANALTDDQTVPEADWTWGTVPGLGASRGCRSTGTSREASSEPSST